MFIQTKLFKDYMVEPDQYDNGMIDAYLEMWNSHFCNSPDHPRVGDFIITPEGEYVRAAYHHWKVMPDA